MRAGRVHSDRGKILHMFLIACTTSVDEAVVDGSVNGGAAGMANIA